MRIFHTALYYMEWALYTWIDWLASFSKALEVGSDHPMMMEA